MNTPSNSAVALMTAMLLLACGQADQATPGVEMERIIESYAAYMDDMSEAMASVRDPTDANRVASQIRDEFEPRGLAIIESIVELHEAYSDEQIWEAADTLDQASVEARIGGAIQRFDQQVERLDAQPRLQTAELLTALRAWGATMDRLALQLQSGITAPAPGNPTAPAGSREWCQQMLQKPEAQWTMQESLTFANRCIG